jgi:sulfite exporter TauE/SafE
MQNELQLLLFAAITIACLHTAAGPDHYLPFIALSKTKNWSLKKTIGWTLVCGCGHIGSSVVLGLAGGLIGWSISSLQWFDGIRGNVAGWVLIGFGAIYGIWGLIRAKQNRNHKHFDMEHDGSIYVYEHRHGETVWPQKKYAVTPWVLFIIFVLGPCEPMIPLLYFPVVQVSWWNMSLLIIVYSFFTLLTMLLMVLLGYYGLSFFKPGKLEKYMHALAGFTLFICGWGMVFMNW